MVMDDDTTGLYPCKVEIPIYMDSIRVIAPLEILGKWDHPLAQSLRQAKGKRLIHDFHIPDRNKPEDRDLIRDDGCEVKIHRPTKRKVLERLNRWFLAERIRLLGVDIAIEIPRALRRMLDLYAVLRCRNPITAISLPPGKAHSRYLGPRNAPRVLYIYNQTNERPSPVDGCVRTKCEVRWRGVRATRRAGIATGEGVAVLQTDLLELDRLRDIYLNAVNLIKPDCKKYGKAIRARCKSYGNLWSDMRIGGREWRNAMFEIKDECLSAVAFVLACRKWDLEPRNYSVPLVRSLLNQSLFYRPTEFVNKTEKKTKTLDRKKISA